MRPIKKILVATDFSPCARAALDAAVELAAPLQASILLLHVYAVPTEVLPDGSILSLDGLAVERIERALDDELCDERRRAQRRGVAIAVEHADGQPAEVILRRAAEEHIDLIVAGTHGRRGLKRLVLGSVAERVLRTASCPVLVVRERGEG
jgi:nucleotide-binding universal stress UspA family protein